MEQVHDREALMRSINDVSRSAAGYSTNLYAAVDQLDRWLAAAPLWMLQAPGTLLVLRPDRDFQRIYHAAEDLLALTEALATLPPGRYVTDLVGRGEGLDRACAAYAGAGFGHHAFLARMSCTQAPAALAASDTMVAATSADVPAVAAFLDRLLDRLAEQLPDRDELFAAAAEGRLLVVRHDATVTGMLMYDIKGQLAHLRFWHVAPEAWGKGVGRRLMIDFLARCAAMRRIVLWVIGDNHRSIAIYRHYGFVADGLVDCIMTLQKDT